MDNQKRRRLKRLENQHKDSLNKNRHRLNNWAIFSGIGLQMGLTIYLGNLFGKWLDGEFQTNYLENTITILAVFASMYVIINRINRLNSEE